MGVERSVARWYAQRQRILEEITSLEATLARTTQNEDLAEEEKAASNLAEPENIARELAQARKKLLDLGPCPKPMMG